MLVMRGILVQNLYMYIIGCFIFIFEVLVVVNFDVEIKRLLKVKKFDNI